MTVVHQAREQTPGSKENPKAVDVDRANPARISDYFLGGYYNFAVDRNLARKALAVLPELRTAARRNRAFVRRTVRYAASRGVRQFLDLGSGLLSVGSLHQLAQAIVPDCRTVYVDNDPI